MMQFCSANQPYDGPQDKPHLPPQHIPEFWQFVQAGGAQELAESGQAVGVGQQCALGVTGIGHGAEFDPAEGFTVQTGALLAKEDRRAQLDTLERWMAQVESSR